jgi:hypothetical protein
MPSLSLPKQLVHLFGELVAVQHSLRREAVKLVHIISGDGRLILPFCVAAIDDSPSASQ